MTQKPYELLARFRPDGTVSGVSVRTITTVDGRDFESDPVPLASATDPAFTEFARQFAAAAVAERDAAVAERDELRASLDTVTAERDAALAAADQLRAELEALKNPTDSRGFPVLSASQLRMQLHRSDIDVQLIYAAIDGITDQLTRKDAYILFEYEPFLSRTDPLIDMIGKAVGLNPEQIDDLWRAAATIRAQANAA